jgi:hypothetical protein
MSEGVKEKRLIDCPYYQGAISFAGHQSFMISALNLD